jgi:hypothetical protein
VSRLGYGRPTLHSPGLAACGIERRSSRPAARVAGALSGVSWVRVVGTVVLSVLGRVAATVAARMLA